MAVNIVMGPPCSGKSTFIKNTFPDFKVVDLFDFQKDKKFISVESVMESYIETKNALIEALKENKNVVLEHTLLRAIRREMYVNAIKEVTDEPINIYVLIPEKATFIEFSKQRKCPTDDRYFMDLFGTLEIPTQEEGFANVYVIMPRI